MKNKFLKQAPDSKPPKKRFNLHRLLKSKNSKISNANSDIAELDYLPKNKATSKDVMPSPQELLGIQTHDASGVHVAVDPSLDTSSASALNTHPKHLELQDVYVIKQPKVRRSFVIFSYATAGVICLSIILALMTFWPYLSGVLRGETDTKLRQFNQAFLNSFQTDNQEVKLDFTETGKQVVTILPSISANSIEQVTIEASTETTIQYLNQSSLSSAEVDLVFDLILKEENTSNNVVLIIKALFLEDQQVLIQIRNFTINGRLAINSQHLNQWINFSNAQIESDDESKILQYVKVLLQRYDPYRYMILLPSFNISHNQDYNQVDDLLQKSQAYSLDQGSCRNLTASNWQCKLTIDFNKLYKFYTQVYSQVFKTDLPNYYEYLNQNLPISSELLVTFDVNRKQLVGLTNIDIEEDPTFTFNLSFDNYNSLDFLLPEVDSSLTWSEYNRQLSEVEIVD